MEKLVEQDGELRASGTPEDHPGRKQVDKYVYVVLAIFLGDFGIHKFYAGRTREGILYLVFCWTFIPWFLSFLDAIRGMGEIKDIDNKIWV
jgi:TM2 domain-containing membrane protein YozV